MQECENFRHLLVRETDKAERRHLDDATTVRAHAVAHDACKIFVRILLRFTRELDA